MAEERAQLLHPEDQNSSQRDQHGSNMALGEFQKGPESRLGEIILDDSAFLGTLWGDIRTARGRRPIFC